eukprot:XP_011668179.1 PREDICTED: uncharacterized protein LOC105440107 [Strongylocentrotus purpuratus]
MLITSSANRSSAGAAIGGVGLLLSPSAYDSIASMRSHSDRILVANFQGNPATTVITTYCPTNVVNEDIIEGHYDNLRRAIDSIPAHNVLLVVGDFNARIGPEDAKYTYHETTNKNGKCLVDMAVEKNLVIASGQLKGDTQKDRVINWFNHFKNLLGSPPDIDDEDEEILPILESLNIKTGPFDLKEYSKAIKSLVEGKSFGEDGIPPEVLKRCDLDEIILSFCNNALINEEKPHQWSILNIVPIPKSGDLSQGGNFRGISLSSIVAKTFNRLILNRIRPVLDSHLRTNQNGFRVGRTTVGHILALRRLIEGVKENQLPAIITCIDFRKAFDIIHRGKMLKILTAYGIPEQLVNAIGTQVYFPARSTATC